MSLTGELLERIQIPVMGLYGTRSDLAEDVQFLERHLGNFKMRWVEGASHSVLWEATETVIEEIQTWVGEGT